MRSYEEILKSVKLWKEDQQFEEAKRKYTCKKCLYKDISCNRAFIAEANGERDKGEICGAFQLKNEIVRDCKNCKKEYICDSIKKWHCKYIRNQFEECNNNVIYGY